MNEQPQPGTAEPQAVDQPPSQLPAFMQTRAQIDALVEDMHKSEALLANYGRKSAAFNTARLSLCHGMCEILINLLCNMQQHAERVQKDLKDACAAEGMPEAAVAPLLAVLEPVLSINRLDYMVAVQGYMAKERAALRIELHTAMASSAVAPSHNGRKRGA